MSQNSDIRFSVSNSSLMDVAPRPRRALPRVGNLPSSWPSMSQLAHQLLEMQEPPSNCRETRSLFNPTSSPKECSEPKQIISSSRSELETTAIELQRAVEELTSLIRTFLEKE
ncbi:hypothetical protein PQX77_018887 [Marasmius sp. AFHP31]|nr:hypothetical protein PQX77_018887 [Marasmius sp. AFHP31]